MGGEPVPTPKPEGAIVFYDGVCGFCDAFVQFLLRRDRMHRMRFAAIQGQTAAKLLDTETTQNISTMVFLDHGQIYKRSDAAIKSISRLGGIWSLLGVFWAVPRPIRNGVYNIVVKYRYRIFGKLEACRIPSPEERSRFLD